jgi:FkbM family methyltransferase
MAPAAGERLSVLRDSARRIAVRMGVRDLLLGAGRFAFPPGEPRVVQVTLDGIRLLVLANEDVGRRIAMLRRYEPRDSRLLGRLVRRTDVCADIGANTGFYTMLMAARASAGAVHAFEPMQLNWHLLSAGALLNGFAHVTAVHAALGDRDATAEFSEAADGAYSSLRAVGRVPEARRVSVAMQRLDDYAVARALRFDVIKIDVEGGEGLVLAGAEGLFADPALRPRVAMIELAPRNLQAYGESIEGILARLSAWGYSGFVATEQLELRRYDPALADSFENVFFARNELDLAPA